MARLDNTGDVLLAGPAVRAVASGARRVTFLAGPAGHAAAELLPGVDEVLAFDAPWVSLEASPVDPQAIEGLVAALRERAIDQAFVLTSFHQSPLPLALLLRLAGIPQIAGASVDHPGSLLDVRVRPDSVADSDRDGHEVMRALSVVAALGHRLPRGDDGRLALRRPLPRAQPFGGERYVVVHPGASVPARRWPTERARALVDLLVERGWRVAVTGGPAETARTAAVAGRLRPQVADLGGRTDLRALAAVIDGAAALVSGNTGPAHLAAAVATPVVSIFAPVVPAARWKPWRVPLALLGDQRIGCAGCRARRCPFEDQPCIRGVTPEVVAAAVRELAGTPAEPHRGAPPLAGAVR